ncbi:MAG: hypothetical protein ACP5U2_16770, partial [Bryobacteraceae bacterium]
MTDRLWSWLPEIVSAIFGIAGLAVLVAVLRHGRARGVWRGAAWAAALGLALGLLLTPLRTTRWWPRAALWEWLRGGAPVVAAGCLAVSGWTKLRRRAAAWDPRRRAFLEAAAGAAAVAPLAVAGFGMLVQRLDLRALEVELPVTGLPDDLEGLRIAQLTDIHLGPFLSERELARAVAMANEFRPHLAVVTG